jgi:hypothetical protein
LTFSALGSARKYAIKALLSSTTLLVTVLFFLPHLEKVLQERRAGKHSESVFDGIAGTPPERDFTVLGGYRQFRPCAKAHALSNLRGKHKVPFCF